MSGLYAKSKIPEKGGKAETQCLFTFQHVDCIMKTNNGGRNNMLIEYGNTVVASTWELTEVMPTGYSRIYYVLEGEPVYESADTRQVLKPGFL